MGLVTLGYEGRTAAEVIDLVRDCDVLADVRRTPLSHKPGLSKTRLAEATRAAGVEYLHLPDLGVPKEQRDAFRAGERTAVTAFARQVMAAPALRDLAALARERTVALLCFEHDVAHCHRRVVADEVARIAGVTVTHR